MSNKQNSTVHRARQALVAVLPRNIDVRLVDGDATPELTVNGQSIRLCWVGEGSPGNVRRALADAQYHPDVVVARQLTPGARDWLSNEGIGWVDETGAAEIALGSIIVSRTGKPSKTRERPPNWTPAVIAVAEALLCGKKATVAAVEEVTTLSTGSCTHALKVLTKRGLLEADAKRGPRSARRVVDFERLLAEYTSAVLSMPESISLQVGVTWRDPVSGLIAAGEKWNNNGTAWAATGTVAATAIAPYLTRITSSEVYVDSDSIVGLETIAKDAGLRPIEGGRLTLRPFPTAAVRMLATDVDGLRVAPWPRVYADLQSIGVRGEEAAEHLKDVIDAR